MSSDSVGSDNSQVTCKKYICTYINNIILSAYLHM